MTRKSNPFGKSISAEAVRNGTAEPYATYRAGALTWKVLKTWQRPDKEKDNQYARWFVLGESPAAGKPGGPPAHTQEQNDWWKWVQKDKNGPFQKLIARILRT